MGTGTVDRRCGGPVQDEMTQGRGEELAIPHSRGRQEQPRKTGRTGGGGSRTDIAVDKCRNERVDRVARYQFDKYVERVLL